NPNGSIDTSFNPNIGGGLQDVQAIAIQASDNKIMIGGGFSTVDTVTRNHLARLKTDGTLDASFDRGSDFTGVRGISITADGKILIVGTFTSINAQPHKNIARLNTDGTLDATFNPTISGVATSLINNVVLQQDQGILLAGDMREIGGVGVDYIARLWNGNFT